MPHPISNPYPLSEQTTSNVLGNPDCKLWGRVSLDCYNYFFRGIFAGERGAPQAIINSLLEKLHTECLRREIKGAWGPDTMEAVAQVLKDLNFDTKPTPKAKKLKA